MTAILTTVSSAPNQALAGSECRKMSHSIGSVMIGAVDDSIDTYPTSPLASAYINNVMPSAMALSKLRHTQPRSRRLSLT